MAWTNTPLSKKSTPSVRQHRYSVVFDPANSPTKEFGFEVQLGVGMKGKGKSVGDYYSLKMKTGSELSNSASMKNSNIIMELLQNLTPYKVDAKPIQANAAVHPKREQKLKEAFEAVGAGVDATGFTLQVSGIMKGARPRTWTTSLTVLGGIQSENIQEIKQQWYIRLEKATGSDESPKYVCVDGSLNVPILSTWRPQELESNPINFDFTNQVRMGIASCNESLITTNGKLLVSEEQRTFSKQSKESKRCQESIQQGKPMAKSSMDCRVADYQSRTLDTAEITNQFTNVPQFITNLESGLAILTKTYLWPFLKNVDRKDAQYSTKTTFSTSMIIQFSKIVPSFDLTIKRRKEDMAFKAIRVPYPFQFVAPLVAGSDGIQLSRNQMAKLGSMYERKRCEIAERFLRKFDGVEETQLDRDIWLCWNLIFKTSDGFEIMIKNVDGVFMVKLMNKNSRIKAVYLSWSEQSRQPIVKKETEDGSMIELELEPRRLMYIDKYYGRVQRNWDPYRDLIVIYNGIILKADLDHLLIKADSRLLDGSSGTCAPTRLSSWESNKKESCIYSKPALDVASNMIPFGSCSQLGSAIKQELEKEKQQCRKLSMIAYGGFKE